MQIPDFRPLRAESGPEPFAINAEDWNSVVAFMEKTNGLVCSDIYDANGILHPWKVRMRWDFDLEQWVFSLYPGFIRGIRPQVTTSAYLAGSRARLRQGLSEEPNPDDTQRIKAWITDLPEIGVRQSGWRPVVSSEVVQGRVPKSREIPEAIQKQFDVFIPSRLETTNSVMGQSVMTDISEEIEQDREIARLAYCLDVVLVQPRPSVELSSPQRATDDYTEINVRYARPGTNPPRVETRMSSAVVEEAEQAITVRSSLNGEDDGEDACPLVTIWMLGPPGELTRDGVAEDWLPVAEYHTFYNLDYSVDVNINNLPPYRQYNPIAGLISGVVAEPLVEIINSHNRMVEELAQRVTVNGRFWTV